MIPDPHLTTADRLDQLHATIATLLLERDTFRDALTSTIAERDHETKRAEHWHHAHAQLLLDRDQWHAEKERVEATLQRVLDEAEVMLKKRLALAASLAQIAQEMETIEDLESTTIIEWAERLRSLLPPSKETK